MERLLHVGFLHRTKLSETLQLQRLSHATQVTAFSAVVLGTTIFQAQPGPHYLLSASLEGSPSLRRRPLQRMAVQGRGAQAVVGTYCGCWRNGVAILQAALLERAAATKAATGCYSSWPRSSKITSFANGRKSLCRIIIECWLLKIN